MTNLHSIMITRHIREESRFICFQKRPLMRLYIQWIRITFSTKKSKQINLPGRYNPLISPPVSVSAGTQPSSSFTSFPFLNNKYTIKLCNKIKTPHRTHIKVLSNFVLEFLCLNILRRPEVNEVLEGYISWCDPELRVVSESFSRSMSSMSISEMGW